MARECISFVICTYNGANFICVQLESIIKLLLPGDEIILSDDNSTDRTLEIVQNIKDNRIKVFRNTRVLGYSANFIKAIKHSSNDIIFLSDQDDYHIFSCVQKSINELERGCDLYVGSLLIADKDLSPYGFIGFKGNTTIEGPNIMLRSKLLISWFLGKCSVFGCAMVFRKSSINQLLDHEQRIKGFPHDLSILLYCLFLNKKIYLAGAIHVIHRIHGGNASPLKSRNSFFRKIITRLKFVRIYAILYLSNFCKQI